MCTVIKVKRKITEDPVECLIIECKKKKSKTTILEEDGNENTATKNGNEPSNDSSTASTIKQILKYVGSASKDEEIEAKIKEVNSKPNKDRVKLKAKKPTDTSKRVDFVMVSKKRGLNQSESNSTNLSEIPSKPAVEKRFKPRIRTNNSNLDNINIIDVISSDYFNEEDTKKTEDKPEKAANRIACNGVEMVREKVATESEKIDDGYVYDIYYAPKSNESIHLDLLYPSNVEIRGCSLYTESELIDERNSSDEKEDEYAGELEEDDDSNDEQNWRNDYPDEEEDYSDNDIDEENDEEPPRRSAFASYRPTRRNYFDNDDEDDEDDHYADNYDEYVYGYDDDDPSGKKLASQMKKSLGLDRYNDDSEKDDYDEYKNEPLDRSYQAYKRRILKEFKKDYNEDY